MQNYEIFKLAGLRVDGRKPNEIRPLVARVGFIDHVDGSAYLEHGLNKVLAMIIGPHEPKRRGDAASNEECKIECNIRHATFSRVERKARKQGDRRVAEQESVIEATLRTSILTELYPRSQITVVVHVLEADGSLISTIMNAVFLAIMQAGISMYDVLTACTVGYVKGTLCLDLNQAEIGSGGAYMPVVVKAKTEEIVFMQLDSTLSFDLLGEALDRSIEGCRQIRTFLENTIKKHMHEKMQLRK